MRPEHASWCKLSAVINPDLNDYAENADLVKGVKCETDNNVNSFFTTLIFL